MCWCLSTDSVEELALSKISYNNNIKLNLTVQVSSSDLIIVKNAGEPSQKSQIKLKAVIN